MVNGIPAVHHQQLYSALRSNVVELSAEEQARIDADPSLNNCGTAYCVAGYLVATTPGYVAGIEVRGVDRVLIERINGRRVSHDEDAARAVFPWYDGEDCYTEWTDEQDEALDIFFDIFDAGNSVEQIEELAEELMTMAEKTMAEENLNL